MKLLLKFLCNVVLFYLVQRYLPQYVYVFGGVTAYVILGLVFTILNLCVRPFLRLLTAPLHFFFAILTDCAVNFAMLWVLVEVLKRIDPNVVIFSVTGGFFAWFVISIILGIFQWVIRKVLG